MESASALSLGAAGLAYLMLQKDGECLILFLRAARCAYLVLQKDGEGLNIIPESGQACLPDAPEGWRVPQHYP